MAVGRCYHLCLFLGPGKLIVRFIAIPLFYRESYTIHPFWKGRAVYVLEGTRMVSSHGSTVRAI